MINEFSFSCSNKTLESADHEEEYQELELDKNHNLREENTKYCVLCQKYIAILHYSGCAGHLVLCCRNWLAKSHISSGPLALADGIRQNVYATAPQGRELLFIY